MIETILGFKSFESLKVAGFVRTVFAGGDLGELAGEGRRMVEKEQILMFFGKHQRKDLLPSANLCQIY